MVKDIPVRNMPANGQYGIVFVSDGRIYIPSTEHSYEEMIEASHTLAQMAEIIKDNPKE
jgi:hypothetical protein